MKAKNNCSGTIPDISTGCAPDNRRPEKICGTCRYFNPEFPVNGKPAPVCLVIKGMKGGMEYTNPPWNATLFSLLKWEIRKRYRTIDNKLWKQQPEFYCLNKNSKNKR